MVNEWRFAGEIVRIKFLPHKDVAASICLRSSAQRKDSLSSSIVEMTVMLDKEIWQSLLDQDVKQFSVVELSGHFESWVSNSDVNLKPKIKYFVDDAKLLKK